MKNDHGVTLVELLIAMGLTALILIVIAGSSFAITRSMHEGETKHKIQRELAFVLEEISRITRVGNTIREEPYAGGRRYFIYGLEFDGSTEQHWQTEPVEVLLTGTNLFIGNRHYGNYIADIEFIRLAEDAYTIIITSVSSWPMMPANMLPIVTESKVNLRNFVALEPALIGTVAVTVDETEATLSWQSNVETAGEILYGTDQLNLDRTWVYNDYRLNHTETITGLEIGTTYFFRIRGWNRDGISYTTGEPQPFTTIDPYEL